MKGKVITMERQAESLGLITRQRGVFELTERGKQFISLESWISTNFYFEIGS
jgi:hypothetical protein